MKLLFVAQDFPPVTGGLQEYSFRLAQELNRRWQVTVVAPNHPAASQVDRQCQFPVVRYPAGHTSLFGATTPVSLPALCAATGVRVAFNGQWTTAIGSLLAQRLGLLDQYFVAAHGREILTNRFRPIERTLRQIALGGASAVFPVSNFTAGLVSRCGVIDERIHVVPGGVDATFFQPRDTDTAKRCLGLGGRRILFSAARLVPRKGIDTTLEAFSLVARRYPDLVYVVVGCGPDRERLNALGRSLVRDGRVLFCGHVPRADLPDYYSAADLFALPARQERDGCVEGFGLVFLEAGACGTAVIGARSGGIPDAIENGVNGLLVPPDDSRALADAMTRLLDDDDLRERLARQGLERARDLSWARCATAVYEQIERRLDCSVPAPP